MNCHSDDYQDAYARKWRELCRSEGHMPAPPRTSKGNARVYDDTRQAMQAQAVEMCKAGATIRSIARHIGMSTTFVRSLIAAHSPELLAVKRKTSPHEHVTWVLKYLREHGPSSAVAISLEAHKVGLNCGVNEHRVRDWASGKLKRLLERGRIRATGQIDENRSRVWEAVK